jgi:hypothetical protein
VFFLSLSFFQVAGMDIKLTNNGYEPYHYMRDFIITNQVEADINYLLQTMKQIEFPQGELISDSSTCFKWMKKTSGQGGHYVYLQEYGIGKIMALMDISEDWRNAIVTWYDYSGDDENFRKNSHAQIWPSVHNMLGMVFRYCLLEYDGLVIHASTLKWNGKGIMFSAPSGTGKSTHVKLWQDYIHDVKILNDDTPAVRIIEDQPYVFGTPWSGSEFLHSNDSAPLSAIVMLEQAKENQIFRLNNQQAINRLMPRVFLPYFDQNMMNKALSIYEKIIRSVPVYLLQCRPDREAVELVYRCLE